MSCTRKTMSFLAVLVFLTVCMPIQAGFLLLQYEYQKARKQMANQMLYIGEELYNSGNLLLSIPAIYKFVKLQGGWIFTEDMMFMTESQRQGYWNENKKPFEDYIPNLAHITHADSLVAEAYNCALLSKGILLNISTKIHQYVLDSQDNSLKKTYDKYIELNNRYQQQILSRENNHHVSHLGPVIDSLRNILNQKIPTDRMSILQNLQWMDIKNCMSEEDASIEFIKFPTQEGRILYAALVIRKDYTVPIMKELFYEDQLLLSYTYPYINDSIAYQKIWKTLLPYLNGVKNLYFSPVGVLHKVAMEYLPDEQALPINWLYNMYRLSSTREILMAHASQKKNVRTILFGGLNYTMNKNISHKETSDCRNDERLTRNVRRMREAINNIDYLPGTLKEIQYIAESLNDQGLTYELISGDEGTEQRFRKIDGQSFDIIHVATHGFYYTNSIETDKDSLARIPDEEKMMLNSGLFLAGANQGLDNLDLSLDNDGILTAMEVSQLDLTHTDMVTLSACETALGEISGDRVFGLQRGFKKAGVQSQLVSLWPVNDEATSVFMTSFYKYYITSNSKYRALRLAQQALCRAYDGKYDDTRFWGAFILIDGVDLTSDIVHKNTLYKDSLHKARLNIIQNAKNLRNRWWEDNTIKRYADRINRLCKIKLIDTSQRDSLLYTLSLSFYNGNTELLLKKVSELISKLKQKVSKSISDIECADKDVLISEDEDDIKDEKDLENILIDMWKKRKMEKREKQED